MSNVKDETGKNMSLISLLGEFIQIILITVQSGGSVKEVDRFI